MGIGLIFRGIGLILRGIGLLFWGIGLVIGCSLVVVSGIGNSPGGKKSNLAASAAKFDFGD